jgi:hypothetical protein
MNASLTSRNFASMPLSQFKASTNLTPRQAEAKEVVDTLTSRMQELAGQDGIGRDLPDGHVTYQDDYRTNSVCGPSHSQYETLEFDRESGAMQSYKKNRSMESPYGDVGTAGASYRVDGEGKQHYESYYTFNGETRQNAEIIVDPAGNLVQFAF